MQITIHKTQARLNDNMNILLKSLYLVYGLLVIYLVYLLILIKCIMQECLGIWMLQ
jgi:hypothetical protein